MSADFYFGMIVGMVVVLVGVAALLIWAKGSRESFSERSLLLMIQSNRFDEDKVVELRLLSRAVQEVADQCRVALGNSSAAGGLAVGAVMGSKESPSGGLSAADDALQARARAGSLLAMALAHEDAEPEALAQASEAR